LEKCSVYEIAKAIGADYHGPDGAIDTISTDSRDLSGSCLFVALVGERVDGHRFIPAALQNGAAFAVAHQKVPGDDSRVLYVKDTFPVLMEIAHYYRRRFTLKTVGVTGSVGKTTTKEFIAAVLKEKYLTLKSQGNQNNEIGLPKTIFQLDSSHQAAVLEMGMSGLREIAQLTRIVEPDVGVITNIGVSHMELLGSRENILKAKLEITEGMKDGAPLLLCGDNDLLSTVRDSRLRLIFYGIDNPACQILAKNIREKGGSTSFTICYGGREYPAVIPTVGRHNVYNALAAFGVGLCLEILPEDSIRALADYSPAGMRQRMVEHGGVTFVEDCYNASPDSMVAALNTLASYPVEGRRYCVFADMLELGEISAQSHFEIGALAAEKKIDGLFTFGAQAVYYCKGAAQKGLANCQHLSTHEQLAQAVLAAIRPGDLVWVKGSRGMELEKVLGIIYEEC